MKNIINKIKLIVVINPVIVILVIFLTNIESQIVKGLLAATVVILCSLVYSLLDQLSNEI